MKKLFFLLVSIVMINSFVQVQKKTFMRFYSASGNKFEKGYFAGTTDSSIVVYKDTGKLEIPISRIGTIKTKRSLGHNILICGSTGAVVLGIYGAATGEPKVNDGTFGGVIHDAFTYSSGEGFASGLIVGGIVGTATGALIQHLEKVSFLK